MYYLFVSATKYIPSVQNDYNCKFLKNDKCNAKWAVRDWQIDETSSRTRQFLDDNRWEGVIHMGDVFDDTTLLIYLL